MAKTKQPNLNSPTTHRGTLRNTFDSLLVAGGTYDIIIKGCLINNLIGSSYGFKVTIEGSQIKKEYPTLDALLADWYLELKQKPAVEG